MPTSNILNVQILTNQKTVSGQISTNENGGLCQPPAAPAKGERWDPLFLIIVPQTWQSSDQSAENNRRLDTTQSLQSSQSWLQVQTGCEAFRLGEIMMDNPLTPCLDTDQVSPITLLSIIIFLTRCFLSSKKSVLLSFCLHYRIKLQSCVHCSFLHIYYIERYIDQCYKRTQGLLLMETLP